MRVFPVTHIKVYKSSIFCPLLFTKKKKTNVTSSRCWKNWTNTIFSLFFLRVLLAYKIILNSTYTPNNNNRSRIFPNYRNLIKHISDFFKNIAHTWLHDIKYVIHTCLTRLKMSLVYLICVCVCVYRRRTRILFGTC